MKQIAALFAIVFLIGCKAVEVPQERVISGVVTTDYNEAAFGAIVSVKRTHRGVQVDVDGKYKIPVRKGETLVFSYVGFKTYEIKVENQPTLNIKLEPGPTLSTVIDDPMTSNKNRPADNPTVTAAQIEKNPADMFQQDKTITGVVSDQTGPLPGASVILKDTRYGTVTNFDGKFTIKAKPGDTLQFSFVGMAPIEIVLKDETEIHVRMKEAYPPLESISTMPVPQFTKPKTNVHATATNDPDVKCGEPIGGNDPKGMFESDLLAKKLRLFMLGGFAPAIRPEDKDFEEKYSVKYYDFGCVAPKDIDNFIKYNLLVLDHLKKQYGTSWRTKVNERILGWEKWKAKQIHKTPKQSNK